ncbi:MAG: hypothetical protein NTW14_00755 [bacterium]|nr:hypothetical protein [bacterium]
MRTKRPPIGPKEEAILNKFLEFNQEFASKIISIEGPRPDFPDFIVKFEREYLKIEVTNAPSSDNRMRDLNLSRKFRRYIEPKLETIGIFWDPVLSDSPNLPTFNAYNYRNEIWEWVKRVNITAIIEDDPLRKDFGSFKMELQRNNGELILGFPNDSAPFSAMPVVVNRMIDKITEYVVNAVIKKIEKYQKSDSYADILLVRPDYWEPIMPEDVLEDERLKSRIVNHIRKQQVDNFPLRDILKNIFGEIWVVLPFTAIKIHPE